jgi:cadmium resistance protein CadD (predicted permease)
MSSFIPQLVFLAVGGSIAPPLLLLTILFLGSRRPLPNASALALGYFTTCAAMGIVGLTLFGGAGGAASTISRVISATVGFLLIVLGLRNLLNAPDPDAQPPRWMESVSSMSSPRAFALGMALFAIQIKNLAIFVACLELIVAASLGPRGSAVALGLVLLVFAIPVLVLIGLYATVPQRASEVLGSLRRWMEKNGRAITIVLCFVFGVFFLIRGLWGA